LVLLISAPLKKRDLDEAGKAKRETIKRKAIFFRIRRADMRSVGGKRRGRDGLLVTLGAALALIVLLVLQSVIGIGLPSTRTVTLTVTTSDAYTVQVANAYAAHVAEMSGREISALAGGYEGNATIEWVGNAGGLRGNYSGAQNIKILWGGTIAKFKNFSVSSEHESIGVSKGDVYVVNSTLDFQGWEYCGCISFNPAVVGNANGSVIAQDVYEQVSNSSSSSWLITRETWNFTQVNEPTYGCIPFPSP
jgi:hypothetical protein